MTISREELAAWADGELGGARAEEIEAAVAADPALATCIAAHHALKERLASHFAPILEEPLPERFTRTLAPHAEVLDFAAARERPQQGRSLPRWTWIAAPALAASLTLAVFVPRGESDADYAAGQLANVLDSQLVSTQPGDAPTRILLSFRDQGGAYCRAFAGAERSGIACRDATGWRLRALGRGQAGARSQYRQAGSDSAAVLAAAQDLAAGPALGSDEEEVAMARGWRE